MVAPGIRLHSMFCLQIEYKVPWLKTLYRGSYMSAHVLLNLLNELG